MLDGKKLENWVKIIWKFSYSNVQNFKHIMKELQGAIIIGSAFQAILGYSGLMTILLKYESFL